MTFIDDSAAGDDETSFHAVWWGSSGIIYKTIKMDLEKSFCEFYLSI